MSFEELKVIPDEKANDFPWILQNRIFRIFNVITQYGEENFALSYSGGKDSTVLSKLIDMAVPGNKIPRVYADTGIEYQAIRDFVYEKAKTDDRIKIIKPRTPIRKMLEKEGYPFKSKFHAETVERYQRTHNKETAWVSNYLRDPGPGVYRSHVCPKILRYQFTEECTLKISDKCCKKLKEEPIQKWKKDHGIKYDIIGLMRAEGGRRETAKCMAFKPNGKLRAFQPLVPVSIEWENWFIDKYNIELCELYYPPYNFVRTGCKGCPFGLELEEELETMQKYLPREREQCEMIWKPVYDEYRRIGYRLKKEEQMEFPEDNYGD